MFELNTIENIDCIKGMSVMEDNSVDFTLTDIPYNMDAKVYWGLRTLDKSKANDLNFDIDSFLNSVYRITKNSICIFVVKSNFLISIAILIIRKVSQEL